MNPLVKKLEERLLPEFEKIAERIRQEIPNVLVSVYSSSTGSLTTYQGYDFAIDCIFTDASDDEIDNTCLDVGLGYLTTTPRIYAGVGLGGAQFKDWGGGFPEEGMIVTDEILEDLYRDLPRLYNSLFEVLKRRKSLDE
jgi:hypothetical protein